MSFNQFLERAANVGRDIANVAVVGQQYSDAWQRLRGGGTAAPPAAVAPSSGSRVSAVAGTASDFLRTIQNATEVNRGYEAVMEKKWWLIGGGVVLVLVFLWWKKRGA